MAPPIASQEEQHAKPKTSGASAEGRVPGARTARGRRCDRERRGLRVAGIDPGLNRTGYAVVDAAQGRILEAGLIQTTRARPLAERLGELAAGLQEVLSDHRVDLIAVEDLFAHYRHPRTAILMGHARGVVLLAAAERGIAVEGLSATTIKKSLTGNGHASKIQVQRAVAATLGLAELPEPSDVADALAIACSAAWRHQRERRTRRV